MRVEVEQHYRENVGQQLRALVGVRVGRHDGAGRLQRVRVHGVAERARPPAARGGGRLGDHVQPYGDAEAQSQAGDAGSDRRDGRDRQPAHAADDQLLAHPVTRRAVRELVAGLRVHGRRCRRGHERRTYLRVPGEADRAVRLPVPAEHGPVGQRAGGHRVPRPAAAKSIAQTTARRRTRAVRLADGGAAEDHWQSIVQTH